MNPLQELLIQLEANALWQEDLVLERNEFLNHSGTINTNLYFVESGSLRIFYLDEAEEHTIRFGYQNSFFGALDSFIKEEPSVYNIQALKKAELKVVSKDAFMNLVNSTIENQRLWQGILGEIVFQQMEREIDLLTFSPQERYRRVLKRSPQLFQEIPNKYIAAYLRMTPETFSRIKKS
ncbi:MAG: cyclic nucleotide-binding domain-containing protein [Crocinitomix sp.]|nr:cyclic nucleotide-binding domain-containing protein [Crocinitomix sp.]